jgi:hypothetical protein
MKKTFTKIQVGESLKANQWRYTTTVEDDPSEQGSDAAHMRQMWFLQMLVDQPQLLLCGTARFETLRVHHTGRCWVAIAQAVVTEEL